MIPPKFYEGLEAVVFVALNSGANRVSCKEISASQGRLSRHLEPVLQLLVHKNILKATKGPKGGYTLAKEKRKISAGMIYKIFLKDMDKKNYSSTLQKDIISPINDRICRHIEEYFSSITIEELCERAAACGKAKRSDGDFNI